MTRALLIVGMVSNLVACVLAMVLDKSTDATLHLLMAWFCAWVAREGECSK